MKYMLVKFLTYISTGFLGGVLVHSIFSLQPLSLYVVLGCMFCGTLLVFFSNRRLVYMGVFLVGFSLGLFRFSIFLQPEQSTILDIFSNNSETIKVQGIINSEPITTSSYTQFTIHADALIRKDNKHIPLDTGILVTTDNYTDYEYGQLIHTKAKLQKPESFETDKGRIFDYQSYLYKDQIYYLMRFAETSIVDIGSYSIQRRLYQLKENFLYEIYRYIPEPEAGLLTGILFGEQSALDSDLEEKFRIVGLMHIVVLSGYNISLVIQIVTKVLGFLPRGIRSLLSVMSIAGFALLVGAGPTVIRASIMAVFIVLADVLSARYNITRALYIAGLIMVIGNPMILYFDISFQLSFLATYGLIMVSPIVEQWFNRLPTWFAIRDSAIATVSAQIMVVPLILYSIGEFSLISPLVNVLVLFAVPISMLIGFITALLGLSFNILAPITAFITTYLLKYQLWIVDIFAGLPFAHISVPPFHWFLGLLMYVGIFYWLREIKKTQDNFGS